MPDLRAIGRARISAWFRQWGPLLPLLLATTIVMIGFGAMIPVLSLFVRSQGIDATTIGIIISGWAIGRLISEPVFGWWADSHPRKPQMVLALALVGISSGLMLVFTSAAGLFILRFVAGLASGMFGPAARGVLVDGTDPGMRGQAFGYFSAFQSGGFVLGPAIGALGTAVFGGYAFPFVFMALAGLLSAAFLWRFGHMAVRVHDPLHRGHVVESPLALGGTQATAAEPAYVPAASPDRAQAPLRAVFNPVLLAAIIVGFGLQLTMGIYDVVWPLYLIDLGADVAFVGLTFVLLGLPAMVLAPIMGRWVDRWGALPFVILGSVVMVAAGALFTLASEPVMPAVVSTASAAFSALLGTALFAMVAAGSPAGRTALAQGIYGSVGTLAVILSTMASGALYETGRTLPFWLFAGVVALAFVLGMAAYTGLFGLWRRPARVASAEAEAGI